MQAVFTHRIRTMLTALTMTTALVGCGKKETGSKKKTAPTQPAPRARPAQRQARNASDQAARPARPEPGKQAQGNFTPVSSDWLAGLANGINAFSLDLYKAVAPKPGNLFFSPWSISMALAMTHLGAKGPTAKEMEKTLHFPDKMLDDSFGTFLRNLTQGLPKGVTLEMANRIFPQQGYPLLTEFTKALARYYATSIQSVNFLQGSKAVATINAWVKARTKGRIAHLMNPDDVDRLTRLVLVNTIFFKGTWKNKFKKTATKKAPFYPGSGKKLQVDMMHGEFKTHYRAGPGYKALSLPYAGGKLSMVILLPDKKDGLPSLEKRLDATLLETATRHMRLRKVKIWLPRFHAEQKLRLKPVLARLGMKLPFSKEAADFSGITKKKPGLYISAVIHQANCDVDEEGTVAAAATAVVMKLRGRISHQPTVPVFRADHPFLFLIRDNDSGAILFMGRIVKP